MKIFLNKHSLRKTCCNKGVVLLFVLMVMVVLSSIIGAYLGFVHLSTKSTGAQIIDSQTFYLADAGIHYAIYSLKQDPNWAGTASPVSLGEGTISVSVIDLGSDYRLTSTATVYGQSRTIQQDVNSTAIPMPNAWREI